MDMGDPQVENFIVYTGIPIDKIPEVGSTAVNDRRASPDISVFPTITSGMVTVKLNETFKGKFKIRVHDMTGRWAITQDMNSPQVKVNLKSVGSGPYFLSVVGDGIAVRRVIKL